VQRREKNSRASDANFDQLCAHHDRERLLPQSRLNRSCEYRGCGTSDSIIEKQGRARTSMTEREKRLAREREEIAARVASFKATQQKFEREREEFCRATLRNAREGKRLRTWS
jgi:hypothetical protein